MSYSKEDVLAYVEEEGVKFIRLAFVDFMGVQKNMSIMPNMLKKAFDEGVLISSKEIRGMEGYSRIRLCPDPNTISVLPWRPSTGRVIRLFCDLRDMEGNDIAISTRKILKDAIAKYSEISSSISLRSIFQFYLLKLDEDGNPTKTPYDHASFLDIAPLDKGENVRREICLSLDEMGIVTSGSHHSDGPGQNSIIVSETSPLIAAENSMTFESVVRTLSARNGLFADFSPAPLEGEPHSTDSLVVVVNGGDAELYYKNACSHKEELASYVGNLSIEFDAMNKEIHFDGISSDKNFYLVTSLLIASMSEDKDIVSKVFNKEIIAKI